ncbi:MAG: hypothetical protein U1F77_08470 [Kiritimatiellia bacterium]
MKRFLPLLFLLTATAHAERDWTTFEECTLIEDPANDGDSFHVRFKERSTWPGSISWTAPRPTRAIPTA